MNNYEFTVSEIKWIEVKGYFLCNLHKHAVSVMMKYKQ